MNSRLLGVVAVALASLSLSSIAFASVDVTVSGDKAIQISKALDKATGGKGKCGTGACSVEVTDFNCDAVKVFDENDVATGEKTYSCTLIKKASGEESSVKGAKAEKLWELTIEFLDSEWFHGDDTWSSNADVIRCSKSEGTCRFIRAGDGD